MQEKRREAQRIALANANRIMQQARVTETLPGGIRRVVPLGAPQAQNNQKHVNFVMAAQNAASKIAGTLGWRQDAAEIAKAQAMAAQAARTGAAAAAQPQDYYETDLMINDFPQAARFHVTHRDTIAHIAERTGALPPIQPSVHPSLRH